MDSELPVGWTIERLRFVSGDREAAVLSTDRRVTLVWPGQPAADIDPVFVFGFHDLAVVQDRDSGDWYMGTLHEDGTVSCWASYGQDLYEAVRGL